MIEFVLGLVVGLFLGACIGILVSALAVTAARSDEEASRLLAEELGED